MIRTFKLLVLLPLAIVNADLSGLAGDAICIDQCCVVPECGGTEQSMTAGEIAGCLAVLPDGCSIYRITTVTANGNHLQCASTTSNGIAIDLSSLMTDKTYYFLVEDFDFANVTGVACTFDSLTLGSGDVCHPSGETVKTTSVTFGEGENAIVTVTPGIITDFPVLPAVNKPIILLKSSNPCDTTTITSMVTRIIVLQQSGVVPSLVIAALSLVVMIAL